MDLNPQRWYVGWFFWSLGIWDEFLERRRELQVRQYGTNLCFFLRTILVWAPLVLVLHAVVYGAAIAALTFVPAYFFGSGYFWGVGAIMLFILVIIGVNALRQYLVEKAYKQRLAMQVQRSTASAPVTAKKITAPVGPSFFEVLWEWVVAQKQKICPTITFTVQQEEI